MRSLLLGLCFVLAVVLPASAEKRVALVIGNSGYSLLSPLSNPKNDAALMAEALREVGFEVVEAADADRRGMARAIRDFGKRLRSAGPEAVGLFYYAGHGVQAQGENYLIPLDAPIADEADLEIEAVEASWVLRQMESAGNGLNIVILDACRNNPFAGSFRAAGRGLARMDAPTGSLVAYSAAPGQVAADGRDGNSPYTAALARAMREPGLDLLKVFQRTRIAVQATTAGAQTPWEEQSLLGDFYFRPQSSTVTVAPPGAPPAFDARAVELAFWNSIERSSKAAAFEAYLAQYPNGTFAALARLRIEDLKETDTAALTPPSQPEEPAFAVSEMDETYYAVKRSNLRAGPGTEFDKVGRLSPGDEIEVTGKVAGKNWYRVALTEGETAFVFASLLSERKPAKDQVAVGVYPEAGRQPGDTFKDCAECPEMVVVPAGTFMMGSSGSEQDWLVSQGWTKLMVSFEGPAHRVTIAQALAVGKYEVTFAQWDACVAEGGCGGDRLDDQGWGRGNRPVIMVSWNKAQSYVSWLSQKTGDSYRLLSEAEWEYVARAGTTTAYNTGLRISTIQANSADSGYKKTLPVGRYGANAFGLYDVHGNVYEWVEDCVNTNYSGAPSDGSAWLQGLCKYRGFRGGSWNARPLGLRSAFRHSDLSEAGISDTGFRVARTL